MPSDQLDGMLIAETSETGDVAWIWVLKTGARNPHPFSRGDVGLPFERFHATGAPGEGIAWPGLAPPRSPDRRAPGEAKGPLWPACHVMSSHGPGWPQPQVEGRPVFLGVLVVLSLHPPKRSKNRSPSPGPRP